MPPIIVFVIIGVIILAFILGVILKKKKGSDTPETLKNYFSKLVDFMQSLPPLNEIFKEYSNDGNQIVYKEITKSRNCYLRFERYKIILDCYNEEGKQIFYEEEGGIYGGMQDKDFIRKVHDLYVIRLHNGKITFE
jgi:hypothetical protein